MGGHTEQKQGDLGLRVEAATEVQAWAVEVCVSSKGTRQSRRTVGIDPSLTKQEAESKRKPKGHFDLERDAGTPRVFFDACHLFVGGQEIIP